MSSASRARRVLVIGDGRNDIDMFEWAGVEGVSVAMGQSPAELIAVSTDQTGTDLEDGVATALARYFQG